jgi:hypothetical protein
MTPDLETAVNDMPGGRVSSRCSTMPDMDPAWICGTRTMRR